MLVVSLLIVRIWNRTSKWFSHAHTFKEMKTYIYQVQLYWDLIAECSATTSVMLNRFGIYAYIYEALHSVDNSNDEMDYQNLSAA